MKHYGLSMMPEKTRRWQMTEIRLNGPCEGNPYTEQHAEAEIISCGEHVHVQGFYDGEGVYLIRFMPIYEGEYQVKVSASFMEPVSGKIQVLEPEEGNHGPVRVCNNAHFAYEDGTPYYSIGTTCYVWLWQTDELIAQTLETLKNSAFNKIRFCVFPKHYNYNLKEPRSYPYEGTPVDSSGLTPENFNQMNQRSEGNDWDFTRFNPVHFRHLDWCIEQLQELGIEADMILFHPYDRWGFSCMGRENDERYLRYMMARYAAYRNVWWSLANEYDILKDKTIADWEYIAQTIVECDPYRHPRSIHNCWAMYDHNRPWITHCSMQRQETYRTAELTTDWRRQYRKPVVLDEICYEGNIQFGWGNISGQEMVRRFWEAAVRGGYPGHGETYLGHNDVLWWSHGGVLHGESHKRFRFLLDVMKETPGIGLRTSPECRWDEVYGIPEDRQLEGTYFLYYYSFMCPSFRTFRLDENSRYQVTVLDTWEMTREDRGVFSGTFNVELPGKPYMAIQIKKV